MKKVIILCPGDRVTGGPELLHQFAHELNENGADASLMYYPFKKSYQTAKPYEKYNISVVEYEKTSFKDAIVIIPEVRTGYKRLFKDAKIFIWWLSVDNYLMSQFTGWKGFIKKIIYHRTKPLPITDLIDCEHLTQSEYARLFLAKRNINSMMLSDYLSDEHFASKIKQKKENIICYNPKKGVITTNILIDNTKYVFVPIENMTSEEVSELLGRAKIYIDFGEHPGKDRIPREAAIADCIVITGTKGSAGNLIDIEVSEKFKIPEGSIDFVNKFKYLVEDIFSNFDKNLQEFENYRNKIKCEKEIFKDEVSRFVDYIK